MRGKTRGDTIHSEAQSETCRRDVEGTIIKSAERREIHREEGLLSERPTEVIGSKSASDIIPR